MLIHNPLKTIFVYEYIVNTYLSLYDTIIIINLF